MKRQIRLGVFETNSSSTHAVVILTDNEYSDYCSGNLMISRNGEIITKQEYDERIASAKERSKKYWAGDAWCQEHYPDFEQYWLNTFDETAYEFDENNMEIEHCKRDVNGGTVHALSVYGYES
jgi:hypothetical protein